MNLRAKTAVIAAFAMITGVTAFGAHKSPVHPGPLMRVAQSAPARAWADSVYNTLTERQRVAQLMCPKVDPTKGDESRRYIKQLVQTEGIGSLLFTWSTARQSADMINYAQSIAKVPVMMALDGEWGPQMRMRELPAFPRNMSLGAIRDYDLLYQYGRETARQCRALGINVNFAPVADINSNPKNPVIGDRSYGSDPDRVARAVVAYSRGLEDGGVQAVAKHFPGHGAVSADSHKELPVLNKTIREMEQVEFVPFRTFTEAGLSGIMTAHMRVPAIDKKGTPTSLTKNTYKMLADQIGFDGLVYTDALGMKGAVLKNGNNCVAALQAGADVLECQNPVKDIDAIMAALKAKKIKRSVLEKHVKKVLAYKYALGLSQRPAKVDADAATRLCNDAQAEAVNRRLTREMMTVVYNRDNTLPLRDLASRNIAIVTLGCDATKSEFADYCHRYAGGTLFSAPKGTLTAMQLEQIKKHNTIIVGVYDTDATTRASFAKLKALDGVVAVFFVNALKLDKFLAAGDNLDAVVEAYEDKVYAGQYAAQAVFGGIKVTGTLPVDIPGVAKAGDGVTLDKTRLGYSSPATDGHAAWMTDSIDSIANRLIATDATPGCQILVAKDGNVIYDRQFGKLTRGGADVDEQTMYDLASVSKALGTLPGIMLAVDSGVIELDAPASRYIPGLRDTDKADITIRQLLFHETGMQPALNVFNTMIDPTSFKGQMITNKKDDIHNIEIMQGAWGHRDGKVRTDIVSAKRTDVFDHPIAKDMWASRATYDTIMNRIYHMPLRPDKRYTYSCLNFCLLMDAEQHATGQDHMSWVSRKLWKPLGAWSISYNPALKWPLSMIAPTEVDTYLRRQTVHGYVHDETAAFSGGVQGNAGLFANADDLAKICQMWLNGGTYGGERIISEDVVDRFTTEKSPTCRRGLGFDKPDTSNLLNTPTADEAGPQVYGHLGFTGTCFWVDPKNDIIIIFLTNRVNPTRTTPVFNDANIRPELVRQTLRALDPDVPRRMEFYRQREAAAAAAATEKQ